MWYAVQNGWKQFLSLCQKVQNEEELSALFDFFLTIDEKENIIDRVLITNALLAENLTQRQISEKHHVSIAKITRGSNALKTIDTPLKQFLKRNLQE